MEPIPDHLNYGLSILFIGYNPSLRSGETGHHYANPNNRFYRILHQSGLTPRLYKPEEDGDLLALGYGFTNIVPRPTRTAEEITKDEYNAGKLRLQALLREYRPAVACFIGKGVYVEYSGRQRVDWGVQPDPIVPGVTEFVAPSSSGLVRMSLEDYLVIFRGLTEYLEELPKRR
jgi:TDG/mug DNA glycosylase family protein